MIEVKPCTNEQAKETFEMYAKVINAFKPTPVRYQGDWLNIEEDYNPKKSSIFLIATKPKSTSIDRKEIVGCMGVKRYGKIAILKHVAVESSYQGIKVEIHFNN